MQVMLMRLMSKGEYVIVPKRTKFTGAGKLGLTKKRLFPKFQLIPILRLQVTHDYVHWLCSIDCSVKLSLINLVFVEDSV